MIKGRTMKIISKNNIILVFNIILFVKIYLTNNINNYDLYMMMLILYMQNER